jgi:hypothetical protein
MKRSILTTFLLSLAVLLIASMLAPLGFAQGQSNNKQAASSTPSRQLISIQFLRIKREMAAEWREFRKNETLPMLQKAGLKNQEVWNTALFGEGGLVIVTPIESLAQYDNPGPAVRALGQEGAAAYNAKAVRFVESSRTVAIETRPDLSSPPAADYQPKLAVVTTTTVATGRAEEYENFIKTSVLPTIKKAAPKGYLVSQVAYGGNLNQFISVVMLDSFADLQRYREIFNKEAAAARLAAKSAGIVISRENTIYRLVPELSLLPPAQKAENR